jgi:hypothetical protein
VFREVKINHGRVTMLAVVGYLFTEIGIRLLGDIDFSGLQFADIPGNFAPLSTIPTAGVAHTIAFLPSTHIVLCLK